MDKLYKCDPEKNVKCSKDICFYRNFGGAPAGDCKSTTNPDLAIKDENGKPVEEIALNLEIIKKLKSEFKVNDKVEQAFREGWAAHAAEMNKNRFDKKYCINIRGKIPSLNEYIGACRTNAHAGARMKSDIEEMIILQLAHLKPITSPVIIHFLWHERTRRRDKDNVAAGKKFILDALQKSGKLINDNNNYIKGFTDQFEYGGEYGCTITIEAVEE